MFRNCFIDLGLAYDNNRKWRNIVARIKYSDEVKSVSTCHFSIIYKTSIILFIHNTSQSRSRVKFRWHYLVFLGVTLVCGYTRHDALALQCKCQSTISRNWKIKICTRNENNKFIFIDDFKNKKF